MKHSLRFVGVVALLAAVALWAGAAQASFLVVNYEMNEGVGNTTADLSGGGITMNRGNLTWTADGGGQTGLPGDYAFYSNGIDTSGTSVAITGNLGITNSWTIALWEKVDYPEWIANAIGGIGGWQLRSGSDGNINAVMNFDGTGFNKALTNLQWNDYAWHHYALTSDGTNLYTYKDAVLKDTIPLSGNPSLPSFTNLRLGGGGTYTPFQGWIDGVTIFSATASASQVADVMAGNYTTVGVVPEPSTMALLIVGGLGLVGWGWRKRKSAA